MSGYRLARDARRVSQLAIFALFVFLFLNTEYKDNDVLEYAVNVFLRFDPLIAGAAMLAGRVAIALVWPSLILVALSLLLGRFFCGWACPMGAVLDGADAIIAGRRKLQAKIPAGLRTAKYVGLALFAGGALFSLQWIFFADPLCLLVRSLTFAVYPGINHAIESGVDAIYGTALFNAVSPLYNWLKGHFLSFTQPYFYAAMTTGIVFLAVLGAGLFQRRFWCRNLCPLGALLALISRVSPVKRLVSEAACTRCSACAKKCRMGAIPEGYLATAAGECIECMDCAVACPESAIRFGFAGKAPVEGVMAGRRALLAGLAVGTASAAFAGVGGHRKTPSPLLIRPPGSLEEKEFLDRCVRCGECMRVCVANGLQPATHQAGLEGLWSPVMDCRIGYCEFNCTLCGQVCPTGAIKRLEREEKQKVKIGLATVDRSRCLPWRGASPCIVCEEHCPTPKKAIFLREEAIQMENGTTQIVQRPLVDENLCIGCGICENKCPLTDRSAINVTSRGESRAANLPLKQG